MNSKAIEIIKHYESLHDGDMKKIGLQPKMCPAGIWTIGWGHAVVDPKTGKFLKGAEGKARALELYPALTVEQAQQFLDVDYNSRELAVRAIVKQRLNDDQIGALTDFAYNMGLGSLQTSSLLRFVNMGKFDLAANEFEKWVYATNPKPGKKEKLPGLVARRKSDQLLFTKGEVKFFNLK
jgi:lysozyme